MYLLMACCFHDEAYVVLLGELHAGYSIIDASDINRVRCIVAKLAGLRCRAERIA